MPYFRECIEAGTQGILESTTPSITSVAWSSFQTGRDPGDLGISNWQIWDRETKESHFLNSSTLGPTLWQHAGDQGARIAALNVPVTYPPRPVNGYIVTGLLTPSVKTDFTHPPELRDELLKAVPDYAPPALRGWASPDSDREYTDFINTMAEAVQMRKKAAELLIEREPWNLLMVHFQAHDAMEHWMWPHLDSDHELHNADIRRDLFESFYRPLDDAIRQISERFADRSPNETGIILISDHGMQTNRRLFNLSKWLADQGLLARKQQLVHRLRALDVLNLRRFISRRFKRTVARKISPAFGDATAMFDWDRTKAFALPGSTEVEIYVTAEEGTAEYSDTFADLMDELPKIVDPQTGETVVERVRHKSDVWQGEKMHLMPDVVADLKDGYSYRFNMDPRADKALFSDITPGKGMHLGMHHRDGIFVAAGPQFTPGSGLRASLTNVAPTILACLGLEVPEIMTGEIITEILSDVESEQPSATAPRESVEADDDTLSASEEEIIEKRLRDLGYM
jgi:predicted AlkP superfamily phosphohydrolase/phosphomutase